MSERATFVDGTGVTPSTERCVCTPDCEHPCWMRFGLTTDPCCPGCHVPGLTEAMYDPEDDDDLD